MTLPLAHETGKCMVSLSLAPAPLQRLKQLPTCPCTQEEVASALRLPSFAQVPEVKSTIMEWKLRSWKSAALYITFIMQVMQEEIDTSLEQKQR